MSRKRRVLRAGMAEAWASFAERSEPGYQPIPSPSFDKLRTGPQGGDGDGVDDVSMETGEATDAT